MIQLKNICKDYITTAQTVHALKDINVSFRQNEFVAILGPSGGGKTTMLNIVGGLDHYTSGDLIIDGKSTANFKDKDWDWYRNKSVGFVFQSYNLIPHQTVLANVELALTISSVKKAERKQRAIKALESVGLGDQIHKKPNQLSGGQMQRVAIARALVNNPSILLADEPTGALDTASSIQVMDILKEVAKDRLVVMVTHNPDLAYQYANRIIKISDGKIVDDSNPCVQVKEEETFKVGKTSMNWLTAISLSLNNLLTKKARTILTAFAGSIGIIGIALILSLSAGVDNYIDDIQKESLSSYPITVQRTTNDMSGMMSAMLGATGSSNSDVQEASVIQNMFSGVGKQDLGSFKTYLQENGNYAKVEYNYGINVYIYSNNGYQLNPSTILSSMSSLYSLLASSSSMNSFREINSDIEILQDTCPLYAGRYPQSYDECVIMVEREGVISDWFTYSIGLRDPKELSGYINDMMNGKTADIDISELNFSYDDLINMSFKVILPTDFYQYDQDLKIWKDMSSDENYMRELLENALELKVVGIVKSNGEEGVGYLPSLTEYVINQSQDAEIIKQQMANPEIDVISNKKFGEDEDFDFTSLFNIDAKALSNAFGINISNTQLNRLISKYMDQALEGFTTNIDEVQQDVNDTAAKLLKDFVEYERNNGTSVEKFLNEHMDDLEYIAEKYGLPVSDVYEFFYRILTLAEDDYEALLGQIGANFDLNDETIQAFIMEIFSKYYSDFTAYGQKVLQSAVKNIKVPKQLTTDISKLIANSFYVDVNKLQSAFSFDMTEDDLSVLISSLYSEERSYEGNLKTFGYASLDEPESISIYFNSFEEKDNFRGFVNEYNRYAEEKYGNTDHKIKYTDLTSILMSSVSDIINAISYVLIAFVSVSLIVSSIMIGIITYISVLERTKEIGVLRALGASKRDVGHVFNAETLIIGLISGAIGVITTILLCIPINNLIHKLTDIQNINAVLPGKAGIILVAISVFLTIIAGLIPSTMATKCDPVTALRSE